MINKKKYIYENKLFKISFKIIQYNTTFTTAFWRFYFAVRNLVNYIYLNLPGLEINLFLPTELLSSV